MEHDHANYLNEEVIREPISGLTIPEDLQGLMSGEWKGEVNEHGRQVRCTMATPSFAMAPAAATFHLW
jgi:Txe/YoeB family toxin of Txe-Axe toxin-antitoxin module